MKKKVCKKIGTVAVDSGTVMILDPGQLEKLIPKANTEVERWYQRVVCTRWKRHKAVRHRGDPVSVGHMVEAGYGDGLYDIVVRKNSEGRIAELRIRFIDDEE